MPSAISVYTPLLKTITNDLITIPEMLSHPWVQELDNSFMNGEDDEHDLKVGATFFRQECMNGLIGGASGMESGNINYINVENIYYKSTKEEKSNT